VLVAQIKKIRKLMVVIALFKVVIQQPTVVFIGIEGEFFCEWKTCCCIIPEIK